MDLSSILPMLLSKNGGDQQNDQMQMLLKAMNGNGGDQQNDQMQMLLKAMNGNGGGTSPDLATLMSMAGNMKKPDKRTPAGLKPIKAFVASDILGRLVKFFSY